MKKRGEIVIMAFFSFLVFLCFSTKASATVDPSWAWCPDRITDHNLSYCVDSSINVERDTWIYIISEAAVDEWSFKTSWWIHPKNVSNLEDCDGVNIKFTQMSIPPGPKGEIYTGKTFQHWKYYIAADLEGKCFRCLDWVDIQFNKDILWNMVVKGLNDPLNCAKHEIGHAIMLRHGDPNDEGIDKDIMYYKNQHLHQLSAHDIQEAEDAENIDIYAILQLHKYVGPDGSVLAYGGFTTDIPSGALTSTVSVGIHPTSSYSTPYPTALPYGVSRLIKAAEIGIDNDTNSVGLNIPATITIHYTDGDVLYNPGLMDSQAGVGTIIRPLDESTLKAYTFNPYSLTWETISDSTVNTSANTVTFQINELGAFCSSTAFFAIGGEEESIVGGISVPVDKLSLLAPWIALASLVTAGTALVVIWRKRQRPKKP